MDVGGNRGFSTRRIPAGEEIERTELSDRLTQLVTHLQNQISQPQQQTHQDAVAETLTGLYAALAQATSNDVSPTYRQALEEMGAWDLLGARTADRLRAIFERNQITPKLALDEIREMQKAVD